LHSNYFLTSRTKNLSQAQIDCSRKSVEGDEVRETKRKRNTKKYDKKDDDRLLFALTGCKNTLITRLQRFQSLIRYNGLIFFTPVCYLKMPILIYTKLYVLCCFAWVRISVSQTNGRTDIEMVLKQRPD